jgi:hypothetical protein
MNSLENRYLESFISIFEYSGCHVILLYKQRFIPPLCKTGVIAATAHESYALVLTCEDWGLDEIADRVALAVLTLTVKEHPPEGERISGT